MTTLQRVPLSFSRVADVNGGGVIGAGGAFDDLSPIGFRGDDANLTRYVGNDPADFVDPRGEKKYPFKVTVGTVEGTVELDAEASNGACQVYGGKEGGPRKVYGASKQGVVGVPKDNPPQDVVAGYGVAAKVRYKAGKSANSDEACAYFVQYVKQTVTVDTGNGRREVNTKQTQAWGIDGPEESEKYPKRYNGQTITKKSAEIQDSPGFEYGLPDDAFKITKLPNGDYEVRPVGEITDAVKRDDPARYARLAKDKWRLETSIQTYLVGCKTKKPIGYIEWGSIVDQTEDGPKGSLVKPSWHEGVDSNVWQNLENGDKKDD